MRIERLCRGVCASIVAMGLIGSASLACGEQITIAGSTTVKPIIDKGTVEYQKIHTEAQFAVGAGGSGQGVKLAGGGGVQIGMASRALKKEEAAAYPDLVATKIGLDGIAIIVNGSNPIKQITAQQVKDVFAGKITNWKDLGGSDAPIELITANEKHGTFDGFREHFGLEFKVAGDKISFKKKGDSAASTVAASSVDGNKPMLAVVVTQPNAIGYASLGAAADMAAKGAPVKLLDLDGVTATEANVLKGTYSLQRGLFLLTKGAPKGAAAEFIAYMTGKDGQGLVRSLGFIITGQ
jgi:phosphate transport system substrate-binding protein